MSIQHARRVRAAEGAALAAVRAGTLSIVDVLTRPPKALGGVDLYVLLMRCPHMGRDRTRIVCERSGVWPHLTLTEMTQQQRHAVLKNLPRRLHGV